MDPENAKGESFEDFKNSFFYGTRTNMNFKFLKSLSDLDASRFFQDLLWKLSDSFDDGNLDRILEHVNEWQVKAYEGHGRWTYEDSPFAPMESPVSETTIGLLTTSGHFVQGNDPEPFGVKGMTQQEAIDRITEFYKGEPTLSVIPMDTAMEDLQVRHGGYDIRSPQKDPNVVFPLERLRELRDDGVIGKLAHKAFSFVGVTSQGKLVNHIGPQWVERIKEQDVGGMVLVPV